MQQSLWLFLRWTAACVLFACAAVAVCPRARADAKTHIGLDVDYAQPVSQHGASGGGGGALRLGREYDLLIVSLTPELGVGYHAFSGSADSRITTGVVGARVSLGKLLEPGVFAHVGVGHLAGERSHTSGALDAGITLDLTFIPLINLGVHAAYNLLFASSGASGFDWFTAGAHAEVVF